jgi:hypothetical protein
LFVLNYIISEMEFRAKSPRSEKSNCHTRQLFVVLE